MVTTKKIHTSDSQPFIILPTLINGKGLFDFVVDTGAAISINIINREKKSQKCPSDNL